MITHVVVKLEFPVEEEYWSQVDYADEYYGIGRPLIRCKDCHWYSNGTLNGKHLCMINKYLFDEVEADDYCSRAERKEE